MTDRRPLGWNVPKAELERFTEWVAGKHGEQRQYVRFEAEEAVRAFLDEDRGAPVEATADDLLEAAGLAREPPREKMTVEETTTVGYRFPVGLANQFRRRVDELNAERDDRLERLTYGRAFGLALREHRDGGRWRRVDEKLLRVAEDASELLEALDAEADAALTGRAKKRVLIRGRLPRQFTRADLEAAIEAIAGETVVDDYAPRILEEMEVAEHPATRDNPEKALYLPTAEAARIARAQAEDRRRDAEDEATAGFAALDDADTEADTDAEAGGVADADTGDADPADDTEAADTEADTDAEVVADGGRSVCDPRPRPRPTPRLECPCCGALVPTTEPFVVRDGRACKVCRRCRRPVAFFEADSRRRNGSDDDADGGFEGELS